MRIIATALLLAACSSGANEETLVDELTVLGLAARPPEVGPGEELALDLLVVDPDKTGEEGGFDLMVWFCTAYASGCFERGPEPRALSEWASVTRNAAQTTTATFTVPAEFAQLLPSADVSAVAIVWALACRPGLCPIMDRVEADPLPGYLTWNTTADALGAPTDLLAGTTFQTANLAFRRVTFSGRPPEDRNLPPTIARVGDTPLEVEAGGELVLSFETSDATLAWPYATGGGFEFPRYAMTGNATSMRWFAPAEPGSYDLFVFAEDDLGGEAWWEGTATVR